MRTRWRQRATAIWVAVFLVLVVVVAVVARVEVFHTSKTPSGAASALLRLGPGAVAMRPHPALPEGSTVASISAGDYTTCGVVSQGTMTASCWGDGSHGQLGDGSKGSSTTPASVEGLTGITAIAAGGSHACAVVAGGSVSCWGANAHGELGNGTRTDSAKPVRAVGIRDAVAVAAGVAHTCALLKGGAVDCWGSNTNGQLGNGTTTDSATPVRVAGLGVTRAIATGLAHTCALLADGSVDCWGANTNGELGDGTTIDSSKPVRVTGLTGRATAVAAGDAHTCAIVGDGSVECWGWNIEGQLGNGGGNDSSTPITVVGSRGGVTAISAGGNNTCAIRRGAALCWGANLDAELGDGGTSDSATPVHVAGLASGVTAIVTGLSYSCALLAGGSTSCWGSNAQGQLGDGTTTASSVPVAVNRLGLAPDGSGTLAVSPAAIPSGVKHATVSFRYTAAPGGTHDGTLALTVPPGWSLPSTTREAPGFTTTTAGRLSVTRRTITVAGLTLASGETIKVTYGSGGAGAHVAAAGAGAWRVRERSSAAGTLSPLRAQPKAVVLSPDGSGSFAVSTSLVPSGAKGRTLRFVYTAAAGGLRGGTITLDVPAGWTPPTAAALSASHGKVAVKGRTITVSAVRLADKGTLTIEYRDARSPSGNVGEQSWTAKEQSGAAGALTALATSPAITVLSHDGSGEMKAGVTTVPNGATHVSITFTYAADPGGLLHGAVALTVPKGWSPPSTNAKDPGYVVSTVGKPLVNGRVVTLPLKELAGGATVSLTYGSTTGGGPGATAPKGAVGTQPWPAKARSTAKGTLKPIAKPASVTVLSPDGSGTLVRASGAPGSKRNTVVWVFTAAPGGMSGGTLELTVPAGWSAPATSAGDPGYVTASPGKVSVDGQVILVSGLTLAGGQTVTIVYGSRGGGGPGASAPSAGIGPRVWPAGEASSGKAAPVPLRR